jgi:hypothetical protein
VTRRAPPVGVGRDRPGQLLLENAQITLSCGYAERVHEASLLSRGPLGTLRNREVPPGATDELTGVVLARLEQVRDPLVRVVERLAQDVRRPFGRGESLQHQSNPELQRLTTLRLDGRQVTVDTLIASRVVVVTRNAVGLSTTLRSQACHRNQASWMTSSASAQLPTMRWAMPSRRTRRRPNSASASSSSGSPLVDRRARVAANAVGMLPIVRHPPAGRLRGMP